jgi:hypothetical protein
LASKLRIKVLQGGQKITGSCTALTVCPKVLKIVSNECVHMIPFGGEFQTFQLQKVKKTL